MDIRCMSLTKYLFQASFSFNKLTRNRLSTVCFMVLERDLGFNSVSNWLKRRHNLRVLEPGCFRPQMETEEWHSAGPAEEQCREKSGSVGAFYHVIKNKV